MSSSLLDPPLNIVFAAEQSTRTDTVCNILGKMMAKQFRVASTSIQSFNSAENFYSFSSCIACSEHKTKDIATLI